MDLSISTDDCTRIKLDDGTKSLAPRHSSLHACLFRLWCRKTNYEATVADRCESNVKGIVKKNRNSRIRRGTLVQNTWTATEERRNEISQCYISAFPPPPVSWQSPCG